MKVIETVPGNRFIQQKALDAITNTSISFKNQKIVLKIEIE